MWIYIPYHFEQAISQRLVFIILMLFMGLSQTGCINTLVRAVVDPQLLLQMLVTLWQEIVPEVCSQKRILDRFQM